MTKLTDTHMRFLRFLTHSLYVLIPVGIVFTMLVSWSRGNQDEIDQYFTQFEPNVPATEWAMVFVEYAYSGTVKSIVQHADCIVRARVQEELPTTKDDFGGLQHDVLLSIAGVYQGERCRTGDIVTVRVASGYADGVLNWSKQNASYSTGEQVIAFLTSADDHYFTTMDGYGLVHFTDDHTVTGATWDLGVFELPLPVYEQRLRRYLRD